MTCVKSGVDTEGKQLSQLFRYSEHQLIVFIIHIS